MTVLTRWEPFREFSTLQDRMNRLFRETHTEGADQSLTTSNFAPAVDVYEDEHDVVLKIEVPASRTTPLPFTASARSTKRKKKRTIAVSNATMAALHARSICPPLWIPSTSRRPTTRAC
jgi:HSP20 family molecular chaperone IbpA